MKTILLLTLLVASVAVTPGSSDDGHITIGKFELSTVPAEGRYTPWGHSKNQKHWYAGEIIQITNASFRYVTFSDVIDRKNPRPDYSGPLQVFPDHIYLDHPGVPYPYRIAGRADGTHVLVTWEGYEQWKKSHKISDLNILWLTKEHATKPDSSTGSVWVTIKTNAAARDAKILDGIIGDVLTNRELASTITFYGGPSNRTVRYTGFPVGYKPTVSGYDFVGLTREALTGRKLTISFHELWIDHAPPKDKFFRFLFPAELPRRGAVLGIYNSGDGTIGGCSVGYEIQEIAGGWRVRCAGYIDP